MMVKTFFPLSNELVVSLIVCSSVFPRIYKAVVSTDNLSFTEDNSHQFPSTPPPPTQTLKIEFWEVWFTAEKERSETSQSCHVKSRTENSALLVAFICLLIVVVLAPESTMLSSEADSEKSYAASDDLQIIQGQKQKRPHKIFTTSFPELFPRLNSSMMLLKHKNTNDTKLIKNENY